MLVSYLVLFFDVIYSVATCILRVLGPLIFNIVMLFRLDRDVYMRGLEGWDLGEQLMSSPIVCDVVYCRLCCRSWCGVL